MYYVVYGLLYLFSLLPLRILYLFSNLAYFIIYYIVGYRKDVVMNNLKIAFPEKTEADRKRIAKEFYLVFTDSFIETIKMISISKKELLRRGNCDFGIMDAMVEKGRNVHILCGHQFNWEFANLIYGMRMKAQFVVVYAPIGNKIFDRIFLNFRSRYGSILVSAREFAKKMPQIFSKQYMLILAADQNPSNVKNSYWMNFFGRAVPFVRGPGKGAVKENTAVVFVAFDRPKRGHYSFKSSLIADNGAEHTPEEITAKYRDLVEKAVRHQPHNYLWSHRRWRHEWKEEYGKVIK